jgi:hypothetical protein
MGDVSAVVIVPESCIGLYVFLEANNINVLFFNKIEDVLTEGYSCFVCPCLFIKPADIPGEDPY